MLCFIPSSVKSPLIKSSNILSILGLFFWNDFGNDTFNSDITAVIAVNLSGSKIGINKGFSLSNKSRSSKLTPSLSNHSCFSLSNFFPSSLIFFGSTTRLPSSFLLLISRTLLPSLNSNSKINSSITSGFLLAVSCAALNLSARTFFSFPRYNPK